MLSFEQWRCAMIGAHTHGPVRCSDCDREFVNPPDVTGNLCEECCDARDAHTSAIEFRMAKATVRLKVDTTREVA
jgi:hypothetical protein